MKTLRSKEMVMNKTGSVSTFLEINQLMSSLLIAVVMYAR